MARCVGCGATILFGGVKEGGQRFCKEECFDAAQGQQLLSMGALLPDELVDERLLDAHDGPCPLCTGSGPVDVYWGHRVWSAVYVTSWSSVSKVCCRRCGIKHQLSCIVYCITLGWWGFPWGLVAVPIQLGRNVVAVFSGPKRDVPSAELEQMVRMALAAELVAQSQEHVEPTADAPPAQ